MNGMRKWNWLCVRIKQIRKIIAYVKLEINWGENYFYKKSLIK